MPMYEYVCPLHGKFERFTPNPNDKIYALCLKEDDGAIGPCLAEAPRVEFSVPARRNPEHGIQ